MSQNTEQNVRTREEQAETLAFEIALWGKSNLHERSVVAAKNLREAEARGAAEQRRKDAEGVYQILNEDGEWSFVSQDEYLQAPYEGRRLTPAALETRVKQLEGICRHIVWTEEEHGLGSRGHDSALQAARAALTREGGV